MCSLQTLGGGNPLKPSQLARQFRVPLKYKLSPSGAGQVIKSKKGPSFHKQRKVAFFSKKAAMEPWRYQVLGTESLCRRWGALNHHEREPTHSPTGRPSLRPCFSQVSL